MLLVFMAMLLLAAVECGNDTAAIEAVIDLSNYNLNNVNNMLIYKNKFILIGGENFLLKLTPGSKQKELEMNELIRYGPVYDSRQCKFYPSEECNSFNNEKYLTNNYNKLMIAYKPSSFVNEDNNDDDMSVITCWTAFQGICDVRLMSNLNTLVVNSTVPSVANDAFNSTVAFVTLSPSLQQILLVATTYNNNGPYRDDVPAIAGRALQPTLSQQKYKQLQFMQILTNNNQGLKESKSSIEFMSRQLKTFIVKYVDGFRTKFYNYFLTLQHLDVTASSAGAQLVQTKIIRFCQNDLSFIKSYIEQPLRCESDTGVFYNELVHSRLIEYSYGDKRKMSFLVGLFQENKRYSMQNASDLNGSKPIRQAVCVYKMNDINRRFTQNFKSCLTSTTSDLKRGLSYIKPDQVCKSSIYGATSNDQQQTGDTENGEVDNEVSDNYCSIIDSTNMNLYPIGGQLAAKTDLVFEINEPTVLFNHLNFKFSSTNKQATLVLLSNSNNLLRFYSLSLNSKARSLKLLSEVNLNPQSTLTTRPLVIDRPLTNLEFNSDKKKVFVVNKNFFYQISVDDDNSSEQTSSLFVSSIEPTLITDYQKQKWIEIQLLSEIKSNKYRCQYNGKVDISVDAIVVDFNRLKCPMPHETQVEHLKINNLDLNQTLLYRNEILNAKFDLLLSLMELNEAGQRLVFNQTIKIVNCDAHKSCLSCMYNQQFCKWSLLNRCVNQNDALEAVNNVDSCASYNVGTSKLLIPFTTSSRQQAPLTIELLNANTSPNLVCMITFIKTLNLYQNFTLKFKILNETHAQCILDELFQLNDLFLSSSGKLETNLRLYDTSANSFLDSKVLNIEFVFYKCEILASSCSECSQIKPFYSCGWCLNTFSKQECKFIPVNVYRIPILRQLFIDTQKCMLFNQTVRSDSCPASTSAVDEASDNEVSVKPNRIPLTGGTLILINGVKNADMVANVSLCELKCEIKEAFLNQIKCVSGSSDREQDCPISVQYFNFKVELLQAKASYVEVRIDSIKPNELIQSSKGCLIEITGKNLDAGLERRVRIRDSSLEYSPSLQQVDINEDVTCDMVDSPISKEKLKCVINSNFNYLGKKNIVYEIDRQVSGQKYPQMRISSNPLIISINKKETLLQGGTRFELQGYNFNLIQKIQVFVEYQQKFFIQSVHKRLTNERLVFKFPSLEQIESPSERIVANIGFLMDNYNQTLDNSIIYHSVANQASLFALRSVNLLDNGLNEHVLLLKFNSDSDLQAKFKPDLDIYILNENLDYCLCDYKVWLNETYLTCKLNKQNCDILDSTQVPPKPITNFTDLLRFFIGNYEIQQRENAVNYENNEAISAYVKQIQLKQQQPVNQFNLNRVILIITSLLLAVLFVVLLVIVVYYYKKKFFKLKEKNNNKLTLIKLGDHHDDEKLHKLLNKISYLETNLNNKCKNEYEKIKVEFLNEFNLNLIYNGIPIYTYKQYLLNCLNLSSGFGSSTTVSSSNNGSVNGYAATGGGGSVFYATIKSTITDMSAPTLLPLTYHQNKGYTKNQFDAMLLFNQLINNKIFLNIFINVLNKQDNFLNKEREQFSSLLQLLLKTNLPYLYSIVKLQLSELVSNVGTKRPPLPPTHTAISTICTTLTTFDTTANNSTKTPIVDFLLTNWVSIFMYQYINDNLAIKYYRLIKLIKYQLESGPIDSCLNLAKYCLNESYLLKFDDSSYKKLYINLVNQQQIFKTYFVLDCDSIKQCKEKFLDYLYKNIAHSQRPSVNDIELELYLITSQQQLNEILFENSSITKIQLKDYNDNEGCLEYNSCKYKRLLCIKDYGIVDGAYISIQYKQQAQQQHHQLTLNNSSRLIISSNYQTLLDKNFSMKSNKFVKSYHLIKPSDSASSSSSSSSSSTSPLTKKRKGKASKQQQQGEDDDNSVKLTRLLLIKGTLQPFIDDLFETLFSNSANLSPIIKHLFDFFDSEFQKTSSRGDESLGRLWKTNIYFLKFWLNILKNPQHVFDMGKTGLVDASLQSIIQVFIDSCAFNEQLFNKDLNTNRLIFSSDIARYKGLIDNFFTEIESYPHISDHELHFYLNEFSKCQANDTNSIDILLNLYEFYEKYEKPINEMLGQQQCSILLPLHHKLVQIKDLMMNQHDLENTMSNRSTPVPCLNYNSTSLLLDPTSKLTSSTATHLV